MTFTQFILDYTKWWTIITFMSTILFLTYYTISMPWWATPFGRAIVALDIGIGLAIMPAFLFYVFNIDIMNDRATAVLLMFGLAAVPVMVTYRIYIIWAMKHKKFWQKLRMALEKDRNTT